MSFSLQHYSQSKCKLMCSSMDKWINKCRIHTRWNIIQSVFQILTIISLSPYKTNGLTNEQSITILPQSLFPSFFALEPSHFFASISFHSSVHCNSFLTFNIPLKLLSLTRKDSRFQDKKYPKISSKL